MTKTACETNVWVLGIGTLFGIWCLEFGDHFITYQALLPSCQHLERKEETQTYPPQRS
jgi:hypothetical protein